MVAVKKRSSEIFQLRERKNKQVQNLSHLLTHGSQVIRYVPFGENCMQLTLGRGISASTFHVAVETIFTLKNTHIS